MAKSDETQYNDLFSSLISDIKSYSGKDPILPWLRGVKKMRESLPSRTVEEKLPRFLQKCVQAFESDKRYRNDLRYLRVWVQLMDFVDDPKALLRAMEEKQIGMKRSLFYQAYALFYEKRKKYDEAEKMYHLGVRNLAEPVEELQKSYEQFLHRMERHKKKKIQRQRGRASKRPLSDGSFRSECSETKKDRLDICKASNKLTEHEINMLDQNLKSSKLFGEGFRRGEPLQESNHVGILINTCNNIPKKQGVIENGLPKAGIVGDDTVVGKFVDTTIVGKSEAEDACHHGLVDPTINMKEAMNAINSMFQEPIEAAPIRKRSQRSHQKKEDAGSDSSFQVFVDEDLENRTESSGENEKVEPGKVKTCPGNPEPFQIFIDDEEGDDDVVAKTNEKGHSKVPNSNGGPKSAHNQNAFFFLHPDDPSSEDSDGADQDVPPRHKFREDTVVHRFVGSTISDEPEAENVCHHGLVDPTINLKEAMNDINSMFGQPIDFVRSRSSKRKEKATDRNDNAGGFSILPDDEDDDSFGDLKIEETKPKLKPPCKSNENDLYEPTLFTKEAMDDINKLFGMPVDF